MINRPTDIDKHQLKEDLLILGLRNPAIVDRFINIHSCNGRFTSVESIVANMGNREFMVAQRQVESTMRNYSPPHKDSKDKK